jgi:Protein of unknown function (DUF2878)
MKLLLNVVFFQALWLTCVAGAGKGYAWVGIPVLIAFCAYHAYVSAWRKADFSLLAICVLLGGACDTLLLQLGLLRFEQPLPSTAFAPVWILMLWAGFALTLNHSMAFFKDKTTAAIIFGVLGGPLAYWVANHVWKAVHFTAPDWQVYGALAIVWGVLTPCLLALGSRLVRHFSDGEPVSVR